MDAPIAVAQVLEIDETKIARIKKQVTEVRNSFNGKMSKIRKSSFDDMIAVLSSNQKEAYFQWFGEFYDFNAEKIAAWDKLRKESE